MKATPFITTLSINEVFSEFISEKQSLNLSKSTLDIYRLHCSLFFDAMNIQQVSELTKQNYQQYVSILMDDQNKKPVTAASYCRSIRAFYYWCQEVGYLDDHFKLRLPKFEKPVKRIYSNEEMQKLLQKPDKDCNETEYICWCFANLCACTGIRLASALAIRVSDIENDWLYVDRTKNRTGLKLHLNKDMQRILKRYITLFHLQAGDYLFATAKGTAYQPNTMKKMMTRYNDKRGVQSHGIHKYRHTFAASYYEQTHDIFALCKLLGHSSVSVTEGYLSSINTSMISAQNEYNPQELFAKPTARRRGRRMKTA